MKRTDISKLVREATEGSGIDVYGAAIAEALPSSGSFVHSQPRDLLPDARSVAIAGYCISYEPRIRESEPGRPRGRFAAYGSRVFEQMERHCVEVMSAALRSRGFSAAEGSRIPIKPAATRAGLGAYGRHAVLITPSLGSMVMFACVVTDALLDGADEPVRRTACPEECTLCMDACPTGALTAPFTIDRRRCITDWLWGTYVPPQMRALQKNRLFGCAECVFACPKNKGIRPRKTYPVPTDAVDDSPELIPLLTADQAHYKRVMPTFPLQAGIDALRGNAIIALGNIGDPEAVEGLGAVLRHREPKIRAYAAWALGEIGTPKARRTIESARTEETDPAVVKEMESALGK